MKIQLKDRAAFVPYITAGDPDLESTRLFVETFAECGADVIELGVPFSDPVADGPTNQLAATRALKSGTTLAKILELVHGLRKTGLKTPIVLFTYLNPIYRMGYERFATQAKAAGVSGTLVVDFPPEEALASYVPLLRRHELGTVFLASPTTANDRLSLIDEASSHFVYYTSRTGVTGMQKSLSATVKTELDAVKRVLKKPIAVGFGISTPEQVRELVPHADAIVVGSAFVKIIESAEPKAAARELSKLTQNLMKELKKC